MKSHPFIQVVLGILLVASITGSGYFGVRKILANPCNTTKTWSIGSIDPRFGIDESTVVLYVKNATNVWNAAYASGTLLTYKPQGGTITVNFVYDERQRTTLENEKLKQSIDEQKTELNGIKQTITELRDSYNTLGTSIEQKTATYTQHLNEYNDEVRYWNAQGGAPTDEYQNLQIRQARLETERTSLNADIRKYNQLAEQIRSYGASHNEVVDTINQKINELNSSAIREFEEGTYDPSTGIITIYEYSDATSLKRVLTHELGHAIGLKHVDDKNAIMYSVNQGTSLSLTQADKEELGRVCRARNTGDIAEMLRITRDGISHLVESSLPGIAALLR